jgi:hypothetical protein
MNAKHASPTADLAAAPAASPALYRLAGVLMLVGFALSVLSLLNEDNRVRFGFAYLWSFTGLWAVVLGSLFFVALQHLTRSIWSVVVRRVAEMFAAQMWLAALFFLPILLFGLLRDQFHLFPWADESNVARDHLLQGKQAYLNVPFFTVRAVVFFAAWIMFARYFVRTSLRLDGGGAARDVSASMQKVAAPFMLVFAVTATFAGIDWIMSLNPYWFSTIFGIYIFAGLVVASLAAITLTTVCLRASGRLRPDVVTEDHLYNLGALLFAFVCFWAYIAFSQYMLIWYANIPEETFYLLHRLQGDWLAISIALAVVRFAVPFLVLLSRGAKMNPRILFWVSILLLVGQLLDLYWLIMPELHERHPVFGWQELGPPLLMTGAMMLHVSRFLRRHAPMAVGDPLLDQSLRFRL